MDGRINVAEAPEIMVSCRPPNPFEKANPARMPRPNSPLENTPHNAGLIANKVQEHLGLDYKAYAALAKDDEKPCVRISNVESSLRRCN
jgi:hypothetical protein